MSAHRQCRGDAWGHCTACDGRIHHGLCTARRDQKRDCCKARHVALAAAGEVVSRNDRSQRMLGDYAPPEDVAAVESHMAADRACGRDWLSKFGCGCSVCRAMRKKDGDR